MLENRDVLLHIRLMNKLTNKMEPCSYTKFRLIQVYVDQPRC